MRCLLTIALLFALRHNALAQNHVPLDPNGTWIVSYDNQIFGPNNESYWIHDILTYYFDGDTLINGNTYYKVCRMNSSCNDGFNFEGSGVGRYFLRDDVDNQKVLCYSRGILTSQFQEHVLFDYSLQVGNSIGLPDVNVPPPGYPGEVYGTLIINIDTINIGGDQRRRFTTNYPEWLCPVNGIDRPFQLVEGIGVTSVGVFSFFPDSRFQNSGCYRLRCYTNGEFMWSPTGEENWCNVAINEVGLAIDDFELYENANEIWITSKSRHFEVRVLSIDGKVIRHASTRNGTSRIDKPGLPTGLYCFVAYSDQGALKKVFKRLVSHE